MQTRAKKLFLLGVAACLSGCVISAPAHARQEQLTVAAASDLTGALQEVAAAFERDTGFKVIIGFGSTGMLAAQAAQGAPFDLLLAADVRYVKDLEAAGVVVKGSVRTYARGRLALVVSRNKRGTIKTLNDLARPDVKRVAVANPAHAPYGRASVEALKKTLAWGKVEPKLVYGENVRQALVFVETGDADAGIIAASLVATGADARMKECCVVIDPELHSPIIQAGGVLTRSGAKEAAARFLDVLTSEKGRVVLERYGFVSP